MKQEPAAHAYRHATTVSIPATAGEVFALVDDHARLSSHMGKRSWALGGGSMAIATDGQGGKAVGSRLRLGGTVFGLRLSVEETVVERVPPFRKTWETVGEPRLLVIGPYRMGFEIEPTGASSRLTVFIEYDRPAGPWRWLGALLGARYARWCTTRMADDAARALQKEERMEKNAWWRMGAAVALTAAILNLVCAVAVYLDPDAVMAFAGTWMHGIDFAALRSERQWSFGGLLVGVFNAALAGFVAGSVFGLCRRLTAGRKGRRPTQA